VPAGGYAWWYLDALSDDGAHGITLIAFIGSVFSPYYAWTRRRGAADPLRHCAVNVALYGRGGKRWAMTERGAASVERGSDWLAIGPSSLVWDGSGLTVRIDERGAPLPRRIRGTVRLLPSALETRVLALDTGGRHRWRAIAPCARVEVALDSPGLSWSGPGYLDTNQGDRPLEADFVRWDWSRARVAGGTAILYDVTRRDPTPPAMIRSGRTDAGEPQSPKSVMGRSGPPSTTCSGGLSTVVDGGPAPAMTERGRCPAPIEAGASPRTLRLAMRYDDAGGVEDFEPPPLAELPRTAWRIPRRIGADAGSTPAIVSTLEDTPFYARSVVATHGLGQPMTAVHESLSLDRFQARWVQAMLPFRMPRTLSRN
jgi:carotenoid 1,2-hydratase